MGVLVGSHPHEGAGSAAAQGRWRVSSPFEPLPDRFEHQPLLWLDPDSLARGDAEELGIESVDSFEETAEAGVGLAWSIWIRVIEFVDIEPVFRDFPNRVDTAGQHLPERFRIGCAGETARHRDNRDRLVGARCHDGRQLTP